MSTKPSTHHHTHHTPYTCQVLIRYATCLCLLLLIVMGFLRQWIPSALKVDFNGLAYEIEMEGSYAPGGDAGDDLYFERIEMQKSGGFIGVASSLNFIQRLAITSFALFLAFGLVYLILKAINDYRRIKYRYNKKNNKKK